MAERKRLRLGQAILQREILRLGAAPRTAQRRNEIERRGRGPLVQHLEERVLGIRAGLAPHHRRGGEIDVLAGERHRFAVALHFELLQVGRQARQALIVGQHGERRERQEAAVPHAEHPHDHGQILLERGFGEVPVDVARAAQELLELFAADDELGDQAHRRPHRVAPAHPIPHRKAMPRRNAEGVHGRCIGRHRDEMVAGRLFAQGADDPGARRICIGLRLLGDECFGADDHQRLGRIDAALQILELRAVHVRHEVRHDVAAPFGFERLAHEQGPKSDPPMPTLTTCLNFLPVTPRAAPRRTALRDSSRAFRAIP